MKTKALVISVVIFLLLLSTGQQAGWARSNDQKPDFSQIDLYVRAEMQRAAIPGLAYAVVQPDQVIHMQAFGTSDPSGRPVTPQTPFVIGSVGKTFTALAVTQLEAAGKLDMDAPVRRYIPWFRTADSKDTLPDPAAQITLRHLRGHASGLSHDDGNKPVFYDERSTLEEFVRKIETVHLNRPVGSSEEYSNLNFLVLGLVVQVVSGQPYEAYIQQNILEPLGMHHTYLSESPAVQDGLATGYHIWYGFAFPMHAPFPAGAAAQGYAISTAEDMAQYLIAYLNYGDYKGISLTGRPAPADPRFWYDLYWQPRYDRGNIAAGHSGGTQTFNAYLEEAFSARDQNYGIVVLLNSRPDMLSKTVSAQTISGGIRNILYGMNPSAPTGLARYTWYGTYLLTDIALFGLAAYAIFAAFRVLRWLIAFTRTARGSVVSSSLWAGLDLLTGLIVLLLPPILTNYSWPMLSFSFIEMTILVLPAAVILCLTGLTRLTVLLWKRAGRSEMRSPGF